MLTLRNRLFATAVTIAALGVLVSTLAPRAKSAGGAVAVQVTGTTVVSDTDNAARHPFQIALSPSSTVSSSATDSYTVPAGKRLVIEYISCQLTQDPSGGYGYMYLVTTTGGNQEFYKVIPPISSTVPQNQLVRLYADPGTLVQADVIQSSGTSCGGLVLVSGYLVNLP